MKVNSKQFQETVEGIVNSMISGFTSSSNNFGHILSHLDNADTRQSIVKTAILMAKDINTGVEKAKNSGKDNVTITQGNQHTTNAKTVS